MDTGVLALPSISKCYVKKYQDRITSFPISQAPTISVKSEEKHFTLQCKYTY